MTAVALADAYRLIQDTPLSVSASGVLANDAIASRNALTLTSSSQPAHGSLTAAGDGSFVYTPSAGYSGADAFSYVASDGQGHSASAGVSLTVVARTGTAEVTAGSRLASVDSARGVLLNSLLGGLLGTNLNVAVLDWNGLATGGVNGQAVADALQAELGAATPGDALSADATVAQVLTAAATAAQADGDTALVSALGSTIAQVGGLAGTVRLGDLLQIDPNDGSLADSRLNALDLVTGTAQLFNFRNVATTPTPVTISGAALGLQDVLNSAQLWAQVVEPPVYVGGGVGAQFHTAAIRLKLNLDLVDLQPDASSLVASLSSALAGVATVQASATLGQIQLYAEVASGQGTLTTVDAVGGIVGVHATPGVASLYAGTIADGIFFNRTHGIDPATDVAFGDIGSLRVVLKAPILGTTLADVTAGIRAKGSGIGQAPLAQDLTFTSPFPETQAVGSSASSASALLGSLATDLTIQINGSLGALLDPLVNGVILPALKPIVTDAVTPVLSTSLTGLVDPTLGLLGVGLGEVVVTVGGLNAHAAPQANDDVAGTTKGVAKTVAVLGNDASEARDVLTVTGVTPPAHGSVVINPDGTLLYTPSPSYVGVDTFSYTIANAFGGTSTANVSVTVAPAPNRAPTAANDAYATPQATPLIVSAPGVLGNDSDPEGDALSALLVRGPAHGVVVLNPDGSFVYTPGPTYRGADSFTYRAFDGVASSIATVSLTVSPVNHAPIAVGDLYTATQATVLTIPAAGVLANDADQDGDALAAMLVTGPSNGSLTLNADGSFTYTPSPGFHGLDGFSYRASDGAASSTAATVTIAVAPAGSTNGAPMVASDAYTLAQGSILTTAAPGVLGNDSDPEGDPLSAVVASGPAHGVLAMLPDGSFTYTPDPAFRGVDVFSYRAFDGAALSGVATVTLTVSPVDHAPLAAADLYATAQDATLSVPSPGVLGNDVDPDGDPLTASLVSTAGHGSLTLRPDGSFDYTPTSGYRGPDNFRYRAFDGSAFSAITTVSLVVIPVDQAPIAVADVFTAAGGVPLVVAAPGVLGNDVDADGDPLQAVLVSAPSHGTLTLNPDGSIVFTPTPGYVGPDGFTYRAFDGSAFSNVATVSLIVTPANRAPVAAGDLYATPSGVTLNVAAPGVLANDSDPDAAPLTAVLASGPAHGSLTLNIDGSFVYTPNPGFSGVDSFTYLASDGLTTSAPATVTLSVASVNHAPVGVADHYATRQGATLTIGAPGLLGNDSDRDGNPITASLVSGPAHGTLSLGADGSFVYAPRAGFSGTDGFSYRAGDGASFSAPVSVTIGVIADRAPISADDPPAGQGDAYSTLQDAPLVVGGPGLLANDSDPDGDPLSAVLASQPAHGAVAINPDGSFAYSPLPGYSGPDSFTYRASDGIALGSPATVRIQVVPTAATPPINRAPVANDDVFAATTGKALAVAGPGLLANDTDLDGDHLSASLVKGPSGGSLTLNPDGSFIYTPASGFSGTDQFSYVAGDGKAVSAVATVSVVVNQPVTPPRMTVMPFFTSIKRKGFHAQPTRLILSFNGSLDPGRAQDLRNFQLRSYLGGKSSSRLGPKVNLANAAYDDAAHTITLTTRKHVPFRAYYQLHVSGSASGVTNRVGVLFDGDGDGRAGGDLVLKFGPGILAGPSIASPSAATVKAHAAADSAIASGLRSR